NLMRFQNERGLRVARSLSRGRLTKSLTICVISAVLHRPRLHDVVDLALVLVVTLGAARDADRVDLRRRLVDDRDLVERDRTLLRLQPGDEMDTVETAVELDQIVRRDVGGAVLE